MADPQTQATAATTTEAVIRLYLSYSDAGLDADSKGRAYESTMDNPVAHHYAKALLEIIGRHGEAELNRTISHLQGECNSVLDALGVPTSPYLASKSWAAWDLAKQHYYVTHPEEIQAGYKPQDPMNSREQRKEIVDRHVGWEFYVAHQLGEIDMCMVEMRVPRQNIPLIIALLETPPKAQNNCLKSNQLAELGALLRQPVVS